MNVRPDPNLVPALTYSRSKLYHLLCVYWEYTVLPSLVFEPKEGQGQGQGRGRGRGQGQGQGQVPAVDTVLALDLAPVSVSASWRVKASPKEKEKEKEREKEKEKEKEREKEKEKEKEKEREREKEKEKEKGKDNNTKSGVKQAPSAGATLAAKTANNVALLPSPKPLPRSYLSANKMSPYPPSASASGGGGGGGGGVGGDSGPAPTYMHLPEEGELYIPVSESFGEKSSNNKSKEAVDDDGWTVKQVGTVQAL